MKKFLCFVLVLCLSITLFSVKGAAAQNWYFSAGKKGSKPTLPRASDDLAQGIGAEEKTVWLTFDAGYENGNVEKTLNILKEKEVKATFFVLKHLAQKHPELCKRMKNEGHLVGNHTANHPNITSVSKDALLAELREMETVWQEATGTALDPYFRPPEGAWSENALKTVHEAGYRTVFWSLAWADWDNNNQKSPEYAMEKLLGRMHDGAVILLHPTSETNTRILGDLIDTLKSEGYRFETVDSLW